VAAEYDSCPRSRGDALNFSPAEFADRHGQAAPVNVSRELRPAMEDF